MFVDPVVDRKVNRGIENQADRTREKDIEIPSMSESSFVLVSLAPL